MSIRSRSLSVISSKPPLPSAARRASRLIPLALGAAMLGQPASAKVFMTQNEALREAFGPASPPVRRTAFLTADQAERVRSLSGTAPGSRIVVYYVGGPDPNAPLTAYFDTHVVRTFPETIQVVIEPTGRVSRVDILSFDEPEDYLPKKRWIDQFTGRPLNDDLSLSGAIRPVTGATLSSHAITEAVRRVLAVHQVVSSAPPAEKTGGRP